MTTSRESYEPHGPADASRVVRRELRAVPPDSEPVTGPGGPQPDAPPDAVLTELSASADERVTATHKQSRYRLGVLVGDVLVIVGASVLAGWMAEWPLVVPSRTDALRGTSMRLVGTAIGLTWLVMIFGFSGYSRRRLGAGTQEYSSVLLATTATAGTTAFVVYLTWTNVPRDYFLPVFGAGLVGLGVWRYSARRVVRAMRVRNAYVVPTVVLGGRVEVERVLRIFERESWAGYAVQGVVLTDEPFPTGPGDVEVTSPEDLDEVRGYPVVGRSTDVRDTLDRLETQTLVIASTGGVGGMGVRRLMWQLEDSDIEIVVAPYFNDLDSNRIDVRPLAGLPLLALRQPDFTGPQRLLKRVTGVVFAAVALVVLLPVMLAIAVVIKRDSPGPVLFRQTRVGRNGRHFQCLKFRTMHIDAQERLNDLLDDNDGNGLLFKMQVDPRVTPVGRMLRRMSLDELPQLINVLTGSMALVGPRPPLPHEVEQYSGDLHRRLLVTPGMTGLWQVSGRSDLTLPESTRLDLYYVDNWSFVLDVEIVLRTVRAVLSGRGAY